MEDVMRSKESFVEDSLNSEEIDKDGDEKE